MSEAWEIVLGLPHHHYGGNNHSYHLESLPHHRRCFSLSVSLTTLPSTTTSFSKIRGFTIDLLMHLNTHELRVIDLVDLTGKYSQYVNRYLFNMRNYGLAEKNGSFWKLTLEGVSFLSYLEDVNNNNNNIIRKNKERKKKERRKKEESWKSKKLKQVSIQLFLKDFSLDDAERRVVEVLWDHYEKTKSKFFYFQGPYDVAEKFGMRPDQVNQVLMNLKQDHIVYNIRDRRHDAQKIGLYKAFVEAMGMFSGTRGETRKKNRR